LKRCPADGRPATHRLVANISAVERAGLGSLNEGRKGKYEGLADRGKEAAGNLSLVS
jgi:cold shock CspA family protein